MKRQIFLYTDWRVRYSSASDQWAGWFDDAGKPGISAFFAATVEFGPIDKVTLFTMSDFGRTPSCRRRTGYNSMEEKPAWEKTLSLSLAAQRSKDIRCYGTYPTLALGGPR